MKYRWKLLILVLAPLALAQGPSPAMANLYTLTVSNNGSGNSALNATATFNTSSGQIVITLTNNLSTGINNLSAGETISDITFTLGNTSGSVAYSAAGSSVSGQLADINNSGLVTYETGPGSTNPLRWLGQANGTVPSVSGNTVTVEALGGNQPSQLITPNFSNGVTYSNANNISNFNPFVNGSATITLSLSGVTADTTVTAATVSFGTRGESTLSGTPSPVTTVPEPATSLLVLSALAPLGGVELIRRRRRRTTPPA